MNKLFSLVQNLFELIKTVVEFVIDFIGDLVYIATLLPNLVTQGVKLITAVIPAPVVTLLVAFITLTVVYRVAGRD